MKNLLHDLDLDFIPSVKIPKNISLFFKPKGEISKGKYFNEYLCPSDAMHLQLFLGNFASKIESKIAVLAVGNSTFPKRYWDKIKKVREKNLSEKISESYQDIDLLILPQEEIKREIFGEEVKKALTSWGMEYGLFKKNISSKEWYQKNDGTYSVFAEYNQGSLLISTKLPNGRELDLILEKGNVLKSADKKISEERKNKNYFSLVYFSR